MNNETPKERQKRLQPRIYPWTSHGLHRHTLGSMNHRCSKCGALMWLDERITNTS
ncbi:9946_t:CDS:2, partial [Cetraspora pellucida]